MNQDGVWLSILEYANIKKVSISTIRRSIKANAVKYREENGKYLIWTKQDPEKEQLSLKLENEFLRRENKKLQEEIEDLRMLLSIYENKQEEQLPPIPELDL